MDRKQAGAIGGRAKHPNKGFGSKTPEELRELALKGVEARRKKAHEKQT